MNIFFRLLTHLLYYFLIFLNLILSAIAGLFFLSLILLLILRFTGADMEKIYNQIFKYLHT